MRIIINIERKYLKTLERGKLFNILRSMLCAIINFMAKKNKNGEKRWWRFFFLSELKDETKHWIFSVLSFVAALFFFLAYIDKAGIVGTSIKELFSALFGVGYFLFPLFFLGFSLMLVFTDRPRFVATTLLGGGLAVVSGLALLTIVRAGWGGVVGTFLATPFVLLFDTFAAKIILVGLILISLLIFFDATPSKILVLILILPDTNLSWGPFFLRMILVRWRE